MERNQAEEVMRLLAGHWPTPELGDDEAIVWFHTLSPLKADVAIKTINRLSMSGRKWRPNDGEFLADYRRSLSRERQMFTDHPALEESTGERMTAKEFFSKAREILRPEPA